MGSEETEIIVLRVVNYSESSQIIEAISPEFGRLNLIAKGARKLIKNSIGSPFDVMCRAKISFIPKNIESLELVKSNTITSYSTGLRKNLASWYAGVLMIEIVKSIIQARNPEPVLYKSLRRSLNGIDSGADYRIALLYFFSRVLLALGVSPQVQGCEKTQKSLQTVPYIAWTVAEPVAYLPKFAPVDEQVNLMSNRTFKIFAQFIAGIKPPLNQIHLSDGIIIELARFFRLLLENALERKLRSFSLVYW